jgi:hypothetical protein
LANTEKIMEEIKEIDFFYTESPKI